MILITPRMKAGSFCSDNSVQARALVVSHCYRESDSVIRLISARRATAKEEEVYWSFK